MILSDSDSVNCWMILTQFVLCGHIPPLQSIVSCLLSLESKHAATVCFGQSLRISMQIGEAWALQKGPTALSLSSSSQGFAQSRGQDKVVTDL